MLFPFRRRTMVDWVCQEVLQKSGMVSRIWITDIIKERLRCLRRGIPNIDRRSQSLLMHQFLHNRIMVLLNMIIQSKVEVVVKHSKMKFTSTADTNKWLSLLNARCRATDHPNSTTSQASQDFERIPLSNRSVTDNKIRCLATVTQIHPPPSEFMECANNQTPIVM